MGVGAMDHSGTRLVRALRTPSRPRAQGNRVDFGARPDAAETLIARSRLLLALLALISITRHTGWLQEEKAWHET